MRSVHAVGESCRHFIDAPPNRPAHSVRKPLMKVRDQAEVIVYVAPGAYELVLMAQSEFSMLEELVVLLVRRTRGLSRGGLRARNAEQQCRRARLATQIELVKAIRRRVYE